MYCKFNQHSIVLKLTKENDKEKVEELMKEKKNYAPSKFYKDISHEETCHNLYLYLHLYNFTLSVKIYTCIKSEIYTLGPIELI